MDGDAASALRRAAQTRRGYTKEDKYTFDATVNPDAAESFDATYGGVWALSLRRKTAWMSAQTVLQKKCSFPATTGAA